MVTSDVDAARGKFVISTGSTELDARLGGSIPQGALTLIEGPPSSGKSVICQQLTYGALNSGIDVAYYTTETTVKNLLTQMTSINLDVTDHFLMDFLRIYRMQIGGRDENSVVLFDRLADHIASLPESYGVVIVDSATRIVTHGQEVGIVDFFSACKQLCEGGRTIFLVVHTYAFGEGMLPRIRSLCDAHLSFHLEEMRDLVVKVMEVTKVRNADRVDNTMSFDVEPGVGLKTIPLSRARA